MNNMKLKLLSLAIAASTSSLAMAGAQADAKGFVEDSDLQLLARNYYLNHDNHSAAADEQSYQEEWAQGLMAEYQSGFTQGTIGFGVDAYAYGGLKLDTGRGRNFQDDAYGDSLLPTDTDGNAEDSYSEVGGAVKLRASSTTLKYGEMRPTAPVFATGDAMLLPETATGFLLQSEELDKLMVEAGHFTAYNNFASTNSDDELAPAYGEGQAGKSMDFAGVVYTLSDDFSACIYTAEYAETWRQHYLHSNYTLPLAEDQALNFEFNLYRTADTGDSYQGEISNTTFSLAAAYTLGAHTLGLSYQRVNGDTPFDYVGYDAIYLANAMQNSDFNAPNEQSWRVGYDLDLGELVTPGLSLSTSYARGSDIDGTGADINGGYVDQFGEDGSHWERDIALAYVVQEGSAKDLAISLEQATHRANHAQGEGNNDEVRVKVEFPLDVL